MEISKDLDLWTREENSAFYVVAPGINRVVGPMEIEGLMAFNMVNASNPQLSAMVKELEAIPEKPPCFSTPSR